MTACDPEKRRVRIAHLQLLPLLTGVQRVSLDELSSLDPEKFDPWIICKEPGLLSDAAERAGISCLYVPQLIRPINFIKDFYALIVLFRIFRRFRFDIVHTHSSKTGILGRIAARIAGVPVVIHTVHGFSFPYAPSRFSRFLYYAIERIGSRFNDVLILLNEADMIVAKNTLSVPDEKLLLVQNGIDIGNYPVDSSAIRNRIRRDVFCVENKDIVIGMVGRLWHQKNPDCLLRAALEVIKDNDDVQFFFIGDGELTSYLEERIISNKASDRIQILGWRNDVPSLLAGLDIFVLPSFWEGMPLAILEAMASSLPIIVSQIPANEYIVDDGVDGLMFDVNNDVKLAQQIYRLIDDKVLRHRLGETARRKVKQRYLLKDRISKIESLYLKLLDVRALS